MSPPPPVAEAAPSSQNGAGAADVILSVQGVSKHYKLWSSPGMRLRYSALSQAHRTLRGLLPASSGALRFLSRQRDRTSQDFTALRELSFEVRRGESVGILGRNGAGKSTLLQIIAGTLRPSTGFVEVDGRIAALLELGSGFNVEYTGRENIYLNGAIVGFSKAEVDAKFDDIAAFADIGQFLEQPVKTYSSGMMVRLAFAVQMAIDPTLFIVDEALAVGDIYFQNKCHKLLKQKLDDGLTLLLVSHDPGSVRTLCSRALVLDQGRAAFIGPSDEATSVYHAINSGARAGKSLAGRVAMQVGTDPARDGEEEGTGPEQGAGTVPDGIEQFQDEIGDGSLTLTGCALFDADGHPTKSFTVGDPVRVGVAFVPAQNFPAGQLIAGFQVRDRFNNVVAAGTSLNRGTESAALRAGHRYVQWLELGGRLGPGKYLLDFGVGSDPDHADSARHYHHRIGGIAAFQIEWFGRKVTFQGFCDLDARFSPIH